MKKKDYLTVKKYLKLKRRYMVKKYRRIENGYAYLAVVYRVLIEDLDEDIKCLNKAWKVGRLN